MGSGGRPGFLADRRRERVRPVTVGDTPDFARIEMMHAGSTGFAISARSIRETGT